MYLFLATLFCFQLILANLPPISKAIHTPFFRSVCGCNFSVSTYTLGTRMSCFKVRTSVFRHAYMRTLVSFFLLWGVRRASHINDSCCDVYSVVFYGHCSPYSSTMVFVCTTPRRGEGKAW